MGIEATNTSSSSDTILKPTPSSHPDLPGFEKWSYDAWIRYPVDSTAPIPPSHPRFIVLFGWGDAIPRHVRKYTDGYFALYPYTPQIVTTTLIKRFLWTSKDARAETMNHIVKEVYPPHLAQDDNVLVQAMSNSGTVLYAATAHKYEKLHGSTLPHRLLVLDSSPGSSVWNRRNVSISDASMCPRLGKRHHIPFPIAWVLCMIAFCTNHIFEVSRGEDFFGLCACKTLTDERYVSPGTRRLYLYGKDDRVIPPKAINEHIALTKEQGAQVDAKVFPESNHVSHMRHHPEEYWAAIAESWQRAISQQPDEPKQIRANI